MSPEEWIHYKNSLEHMRQGWDHKKNILENGRGMPAEKDFKGRQRFGCKVCPQVEDEEAPKEDLWEIQHIRADGVSRLAKDASVKVIDRIVLIYIIVPFPGLPLPSTSCRLKSCERRWHLYE